MVQLLDVTRSLSETRPFVSTNREKKEGGGEGIKKETSMLF